MPSERNKADSLTWIKRELADRPYGSGQNIVSDTKSCPIGLKRRDQKGGQKLCLMPGD